MTESSAVGERSESALLERQEELAELDSLIADAREARARALMIEGPAGIGKTRLLEAARDRATGMGVDTLSARGGELERDFGFGIVRQLLEPALAAAEPAEHDRLLAGAARLALPLLAGTPGADGTGDPTHAVLHGLYWLVANLSERTPLLLLVDDVHWADGASLRFLAHLLRRLDGLRAAVALTARTGEEAEGSELLTALTLEMRPPILRPRPLSEAAVGCVISAGLGAGAGPTLAAPCREATGGNPFLLTELLEELRREAHHPAELTPAAIRDLASKRVAAGLLLRVGRIDPLAPALARATAVLGARTSLARATALADLDPGEGRRVAKALADAEVLESSAPLRFVHPLVRASVYDDIPGGERAALHRRAADLLVADHADPEAIALHLLASEPAGEPRVVARLSAAAQAAEARGAPEAAGRYLRRALDEPPSDEARAALHHRLGQALALVGDPEAREHLARAVELGSEPEARAAAAFDLSQLLLFGGDMPSAVDCLEEVLPGLDRSNPELAGKVEGELLLFGTTCVTARRRVEGRILDAARRLDRLPAEQGRFLLPSIAFNAAVGRGAGTEATELARRAISDSELFEEASDAAIAYGATEALWVAGQYAESEQGATILLRRAQARGSARGFAMASAFRAWRRYLRGDLRGAESDSRACLELAARPDEALDASWVLFTPLAATSLAALLVERGALAAAREGLAPFAGRRGDDDFGFPQLLHTVEARIELAGGRPLEAIDILAPCRRFERGWGPNPGIACAIPWRVTAAAAQLALGDRREARALAGEQVDQARDFGSPPALGTALVALAQTERSDRAIELLTEAVSVLESSEARLEHARAQVELGAAQHRAGERSTARVQLEAGMDLAQRLGATALADQAREKLIATGARPRRLALSGIEALTASERRVAEMAADGTPNKGIAQALFVTLRTVEMHLTNAYRKLEIRSRRDLPDALREPAPTADGEPR